MAGRDRRLEALLSAAEEHGEEGEPEHEVGDLQDLARACWERLDAKARREIYDQFRNKEETE